MAPSIRPFALLASASLATAQRALYSIESSYGACPDLSNSSLAATYFAASLTPDNNTLAYDLQATNTYTGNVTISYIIAVNDTTYYDLEEDPCSSGEASFCPASAGAIILSSNQNAPDSVLDRIPAEAYTTPDLMAYFRYYLNDSATGMPVGCLQTNLTNEATQKANMTSSSNSTGEGNSTSSGSGSTNSSGSGSGGNGNSGAGTVYLNWTLFV
ncbi:Flavin carrier protein 2 [Pseudocercospora fuligena]|uniref:Flavin carrier protein 2 n=1 Tax=Pseudocercospora fuligena TaxID=685502 RepID=A0A8H6RI32_9PEZI|nr:Flavin carrier protein 2 [Pseudocercospora fuligena]